MDVCETKHMDQFIKVHNFEPMKVHTFGPNTRLIRLFSLTLNYAKPRFIFAFRDFSDQTIEQILS